MGPSPEAASVSVPEHVLSSGNRMPLLGMGTASSPAVEPQVTKNAILHAIKLGYRHFDTASRYRSEQPLGEAIAEALSLGLIKSRDELFITSKLGNSDAHAELVLPALRRSLEKLKLEYLDLYLIHWPVSSRAGIYEFPVKQENFLPMDFKSAWAAMEECQRLGLTKSIGVSNFSCKKIADVLAIAKIPPAVNQEPINRTQGTILGSNRVLDCEVLKEIAKAKGKSVAQVCLRWAYEQGVSVLVKSFNTERLKENLQIFDWSLSEDELKKIGEIPQSRICTGKYFICSNGPFRTMEELWDGEI